MSYLRKKYLIFYISLPKLLLSIDKVLYLQNIVLLYRANRAIFYIKKLNLNIRKIKNDYK